MAYENLIVGTEASVTTITLNRPKANALSLGLMEELKEAVEAAQADESVRVILITGGEGTVSSRRARIFRRYRPRVPIHSRKAHCWPKG